MRPCVLRERPHRTRLRFRAFNPRGEPGALPGWSNSACRRSVLECGPKLMANPKHLKAIRRGSKGRGSPTRTSEKRSSSRRISAKRPNDAANLYDGDLCTKNISGANPPRDDPRRGTLHLAGPLRADEPFSPSRAADASRITTGSDRQRPSRRTMRSQAANATCISDRPQAQRAQEAPQPRSSHASAHAPINSENF